MRTLLRSAIVLVLLAVGGCAGVGAPTTSYTFDPRVNFAEWKTYRWIEAKPFGRRDALMEANVRFLADRALQAKGVAQQWDKSDLILWMEYKSTSKDYEVKDLTLSFTLPEGSSPVWRGQATGIVRTDAGSGALQSVVAEMLANFPPKK